MSPSTDAPLVCYLREMMTEDNEMFRGFWNS
jgi:hypothetical protein